MSGGKISPPPSDRLKLKELRSIARPLLANLLSKCGLALISNDWGPRGFNRCFLRAARAGFDPASIIDVGASDGRWTRECCEIFPKARYLMFDALPENVAPLEKLQRELNGAAFWSGALGAKPGRTVINQHGHQSSVYSSADFPGSPLDIEMRTLDSFVEPLAINGPVVLKADVQGYELEVLRGAPKVLSITEMLLIEVSFRQIYEGSPLAHDIISWLCNRGFRIYDICSYAQRETDKQLLQSDIVFVRSASSLFYNEGWR